MGVQKKVTALNLTCILNRGRIYFHEHSNDVLIPVALLDLWITARFTCTTKVSACDGGETCTKNSWCTLTMEYIFSLCRRCHSQKWILQETVHCCFCLLIPYLHGIFLKYWIMWVINTEIWQCQQLSPPSPNGYIPIPRISRQTL